jgi:hypothetical protein
VGGRTEYGLVRGWGEGAASTVAGKGGGELTLNKQPGLSLQRVLHERRL